MLEKWTTENIVNREDIQFFILPIGLPTEAKFALSALRDQGPYGVSCLSQVLPEVVWGDNAREFPLAAVFPPARTYEILILPGQRFRRAWARIGVD
jgi:hypothetical protein